MEVLFSFPPETACLNSHKQLEKSHENLRDYISCQLKAVAFFYSQVSQGS